MKNLITILSFCMVFSTSVQAAEKLNLDDGSHESFLGQEALDTDLFESYEGGSADFEYTQLKNIFTDAILVLKRDYPNKDDVVKRDAHAKSHGCVVAEFQVNNQNLPSNLRIGIFKENKSFDGVIRFSNNHSNALAHDNLKDVRGMSLKLVGVEGEKILPDEKYATTQDLLMFGSPVFPIKNNRDYMAVLNFVNHGVWSGIKTAFKHPSSLIPLGKGFARLAKEKKRILKYNNPANIPYFSPTPYRLGAKNNPNRAAIKFGVNRIQCAAEKFVESKVDPTDPKQIHYLRDSLVQTLNQQPVCFEFWIQTLPKNHMKREVLVEDPTIDWEFEKIKVATLNIPAQNFDTPEKNYSCENLSFTPWHALSVHRPLGRTNRARGILYNIISKHRHNENDETRKEPLDLIDFKN